jgi:hypothetical protein
MGSAQLLTPDLQSRMLLAKSAAERARLHEVGLGFPDVYGIINAETSWVPRLGASKNGTPNLGIAQFEPATARALGMRNPNDPVVEEFTLILQALQLGRTRRMALEAFAERCPADSVVEFVGALIQADLRGNPVAEALRIQAEVARRKRSVNAEEAAARAGVAMMAPLVLVFLCILILIVAPIVMRIQQAD